MSSNTIFVANENIGTFTVHLEGLDPGPGDRSALFATSEWVGAEFDAAIQVVNTQIANLQANLVSIEANITSIEANIVTIDAEISSLNGEIANLVAGNSNVQFAYVNSSTTYAGQAFNFVSGNGTSVQVTASYPLINVEIDFTGTISSSSPGGSNTDVQFNNSNAFGGTAGLTFNIVSNNLFVGNNLSTVTENVSSSLSVGSNVTLNTSQFFMGNTTVNSVMTSAQYALSNSTNTATLNPISLTIGTSVVNTSVIQGSNLNSSGNVNGVSLVGTTSLTIGANLVVNTNELFVGNATINAVINSSLIELSNATVISNLTVGQLFVGNSTINSVHNSSALQISNATVISNLTVGQVFFGNASVNSVHNSSALAFNGVVAPTGVAANADIWAATNNQLIITPANFIASRAFITLAPDAGGNLNPNNAAGVNFVAAITKNGTLKNFTNKVVGLSGEIYITTSNGTANLATDTNYVLSMVYVGAGSILLISPGTGTAQTLPGGNTASGPATNIHLSYTHVNSTVTLIR